MTSNKIPRTYWRERESSIFVKLWHQGVAGVLARCGIHEHGGEQHNILITKMRRRAVAEVKEDHGHHISCVAQPTKASLDGDAIL